MAVIGELSAAAAAMVAVSSGAVSDFTILEDVNLNEIAGLLENGIVI